MAPAVAAMVNERKHVELREKLAGIEAEFDRWLEDAGTGGPLRKHHSQLSRLTLQLGAMAKGIGDQVETLDGADRRHFLAESRVLQVRILEVHRLWDYFRSKLSLRYIAWFRDYLAIADEFAWACYGPFQAAADSQRRDPAALRTAPLMFFSGDFSPYTMRRERGFEVEAVPGAADSAQFYAYTQRLPIPVIGVPWYQVSHLPDAVLIGHEVGHNVEDDLGLTATMLMHLEPVLAGLLPQRRAAWELWRGELFADICGVLAGGPAFVSALADLLVTDPVQVAAEAKQPAAFDEHPPAALRIVAATHVLRELGFDSAATDAWSAWSRIVDTELETSLNDELAKVLDALLSGRYAQLDCRTVCEVLRFSAKQQADAEAVKQSVALGLEPATDDIRCLVAGARLAFDADPRRYAGTDAGKPGPHEWISARAMEVIGDAPRGRYDSRAPSPDDDRRAGLALFDALAGSPGDGPSSPITE